jgi:hypothetical protein
MGDIGMIKGICLPGSFARTKGVVGGVAVLGGYVSAGIYRRRRGGRNR